jgi:hypothetical protein
MPHDHHLPSLNRTAAMATIHCLTGCAIGEVLGMVIGQALGWGNLETVVLSVVLAFASGYGLTMRPLLRAGLAVRKAAGVALASDTLSIATMEIVDNALMVVIPGAMTATLANPVFWISLVVTLAAGGLAAFPVNRWLIARGLGHALVHQHHGHHHPET